MIQRPSGFDVSDFFAQGGTTERFQQAVNNALKPVPSLRTDQELVLAAIPSKGWIADYLHYVCPISESPLQFNLAAALVGLAATVGRRAWVDHGDERLYPNVYCCIVAEQSRLRKSTSLVSIRQILARAFPAQSGERGIIMPDDFSDEGLADALTDNSTGLFVWSEFGFVLGTSQKTYSATSRQFLADLYDCPDVRERLLRTGPIRIENAAPSILTASTFSWLRERVRSADLMGGFLSRFLYVTGSEKSQLLPFRPAANEVARTGLEDQLLSLRLGLEPGRRMDAEPIRDAYTEFYLRLEGGEANPEEEALAGFYSRLCTYAVKLTMLYQLSIDPDSTQLTMDAWQHTTALIELLRRGMCKVVGDLAESEDGNKTRKILEIIRRAGSVGILRKQVLQLGHVQARQLDTYLDTLRQSELIREITEGPGRRYFALS